ncbi:DUF927 domain-containing protein [Clostridium drakei]|uniref:DUF927 domain-containing protein n=1 Tax=Clostridium drakei TaxID=332101 RepID=A0A2U8DLN5_9CLOT|nr:DUF927 domain-containing protein [Clostridium drakei]AWI03124.1 hypothetical protein B9W14_00915 [Clostridium drakei]
MENKVTKKRNIPMIGSIEQSPQKQIIVSKSDKLYPEIIVHNGDVCTWKKCNDGSIDYKKISDYVGVKEVVENLDTGKKEIILTYNEGKDVKEIMVPLGETVTKNKILNLADVGIDVNDNNATNVIKQIRNERENAPRKLVHSNIGFFEKDGKNFFKHNKIISDNKQNDIDSAYIGRLNIKPKGSGKTWLNMINKEVLGRPPLELALAIGFSAPVVGFIANELGIESPLIHLYGDSSKGKTTALMLAVSAFGSPSINETGLIMTWNTTTNAMHGSLGGNTGIPVVFDESSMSGKSDFTNVIYSLTAGLDKERMDKEGNIRSRKSWNTTIGSTGEHSIFVKSKENTGTRMRLFEFENVDWTEDAEHADRIKEIVISNYGHYGTLFARALIILGKEKVIQIYKDCKQNLIAKMVESEFRERLAGKLAILMVTATIIKKYLKINLTLEEIEKILIENENTNVEDKDIGKKAYEVIMQEVSRNKSKFGVEYEYWKDGNKPASDKETWGKIEYKGTKKNHTMQIVIIETILKRILKDNGFEDPRLVTKKWKSKGCLDFEEGKTYRRRTINDIKTKCYVIKVNQDDVPKREKSFETVESLDAM